MTVHALDIMPDHVYLFVESDPYFGVAEIVNRLKGYTSPHELREKFAWHRSRLPTLWSRAYYSGTVGHVSESTVRTYIQAQKGK